MSKGQMRFFRGMGIGLAVGATAGVTMCCCVKRRKHGLKHNVSKALCGLSELMDSVAEGMR